MLAIVAAQNKLFPASSLLDLVQQVYVMLLNALVDLF